MTAETYSLVVTIAFVIAVFAYGSERGLRKFLQHCNDELENDLKFWRDYADKKSKELNKLNELFKKWIPIKK